LFQTLWTNLIFQTAVKTKDEEIVKHKNRVKSLEEEHRKAMELATQKLAEIMVSKSPDQALSIQSQILGQTLKPTKLQEQITELESDQGKLTGR
jgi:hypothetical protein